MSYGGTDVEINQGRIENRMISIWITSGAEKRCSSIRYGRDMSFLRGIGLLRISNTAMQFLGAREIREGVEEALECRNKLVILGNSKIR